MKSIRMTGSVAGSLAVSVLLAPGVFAQVPTVTGANPLQQTVFTAVFDMCTKDLDNTRLIGAQVNDLHDQCHAIAVSSLTNTGAPLGAAIGALQQVSGNQISTQGSLATRVSAGQFGNITGRLNALRLSSGFSATHGLTTFDGNPSDGSSVAAAGPRASSLGGLFDSGAGYSAGGFVPVSFQSGNSLPDQSSDGSIRLAQAGSSAGGSPSFGAGVPNPWGLFVEGSYNSGRHDQTENEDPFDFHATSVTAGIDYNFGPAVLGVSIGHDVFDAGIRASGTEVSPSSARVTGTSGSIYGAWFGQNWMFNGIATYGKLSSDLTRSVKYSVTYNGVTDPDPQGDINDNCPSGNCTVSVDRTLQGNPDGKTLAVGVTAGYQYSAYNWNIVPSVSANYRRATFDSFTENDAASSTDGLALAFGNQTVESARSIVGLEFSRPLSASFGVVTPIVRVEWNHEFKTGLRTIAAHYAFDPTANSVCDSCFVLPTDSPASNYGVAGAGLSVTLSRRIQAYVYDEALFGFANYHSNAVTLGLRGQL